MNHCNVFTRACVVTREAEESGRESKSEVQVLQSEIIIDADRK